MFKTGLKHGIIVLLIVAAVTLISMLSKNKDVIAVSMDFSTIVSWLVTGYLFKKHHGPLITFQPTPEMAKNLLGYVLGVGFIWGPAKLMLAGFPVEGAPIIANIFLAIIAIPFSGFAVIGAILIGGWFYKGNQEASNNSSNLTGADNAPSS